ncbi:MAG: hypothetical protein HPY81_10645 [Firmicutes bacterium]|nr:hypothetical protein [Bacillota bacterium]
MTDYDPKHGVVRLRLEDELGIGDGIEVWVTQGGRCGTVVKELLVKGRAVERAEPGQEVSLVLDGRVKRGDRVFKTHDARLIAMAQASYAGGGRRIPITIRAEVAVGSPLVLTARDPEGNEARTQTDFVGVPAEKHPLTAATLKKQLERLGNTPFILAGLDWEINGEVMVPVSEINEARRRLVAELTAKRLRFFDRPAVPADIFQRRLAAIGPVDQPALHQPEKKPLLAVTVGDQVSARLAVQAGADLLYLSGEQFRHKERLTDQQIEEIINFGTERGCQIVVALPRIWHMAERQNLLKLMEKVNQWRPAAVSVANLGSLQVALEKARVPIYADYPLNIYNDWSIRLLKELGVAQVSLSPELNFTQIENLSARWEVSTECLVHGALTMMVSEHCVVGALLGNRGAEKACTRPCVREKVRYYLQDRLHFRFPLEMDQACRMYIHNPKVMCLIEHLPEFQRLGIHVLRIEARREEPAYVRQVVQVYRQVLDRLTDQRDNADLTEAREQLVALNPEGFTKAHYFRGVL